MEDDILQEQIAYYRARAQEYDLVFFAFWLSHIPPEVLDAFLHKVQRDVRSGYYSDILDQYAHTENQHIYSLQFLLLHYKLQQYYRRLPGEHSCIQTSYFSGLKKRMKGEYR